MSIVKKSPPPKIKLDSSKIFSVSANRIAPIMDQVN